MTHDPMAEIRASFFVECEELLESLQDALSVMADHLEGDGSQDTETINVVFRAVHSIKGGAGAFGLTVLVAFAHRFETVMDELRCGRLVVDHEAMKLFFQAADMLADHVRLARDDASGSPPGSETLLIAVEALMGERAPELEEEEVAFAPMGLSFDLALPDLGDAADLAEADGRCWTVRLRPLDALYASGNETFHLLRALCELGSASITCDLSALPDLDALMPETSCLGWTVQLTGGIEESDIRAVFDFVEDVAEITIAEAQEVAAELGLAAPEPKPEAASAPAISPPCLSLVPDLIVPPLASAATASSALPIQPIALPSERPTDPAPDRLAAPAVAAAAAAPAEAAAATVRVDLDRIDRLVNLVGELVINQAMLAQSVTEAGLPANSAVMNGLEAFMMLTRDIQDSVMMIRAQPVKPLFQRMARIVREASAAVGKEVRLRSEGEGTEVDKTVIERLADPLTHMIRNAVDHGLETPDRRREAGKPEEGVVTLSAQHRSGRVVIEVADDGAGIDRPRVREIAIRKGLVAPDAVLTDAEIDNLLFLPGFSTANQISALSGRGVGMDVVKQAIGALGGRIAITSERGQGTRFSISLPLTLAVLDGMVVRVAGETLVIPLSSIVETATLSAHDIRSLGPETSVIHIRGGFVPLYDLGTELAYRGPKASYEGGIVLLTAQEDGSRAALVVDEILEQRQVVIKGLQHSYGNIPGVAAATILGDGQIALILDPGDLVENATGRTRSADTILALAG
ncbi:chemotaxis protein CheA [Frigidibacter albus]|uniref:Chemotaxis protein CheA n=1 Tax=Frigidibacter albus TaxID=1465486 RepID=A0A6L8VH52_9RHOB|nr:chemotaxis protein CheA [Frigidibacter albus]MZQ89061.1 chemotaxis protein CheA [Frigidibacter albus]NBE30882.1 chemotaxis protein CheA [Frigidibacter albus]GGH51684.1 chemotaxis protein CheA [Frigidibacter albus]